MSDSSTDLATATASFVRARHELDRHGFCVIRDALSPAELQAIRRRVREQAEGEVAAGVAYFDGGGANQRVWNLLNKGDEFHRLAVHPLATETVSHVLGQRFLLSSITANIAGPRGVAQELHQDQGYVPHPHPPFALVANVAWFLDDVGDDNGGTRFLPGSHLAGEPKTLDVDTIAVEGPAGSACIFDGRILHGTGANRSSAARNVVLAYYCRAFVRQQENPFLSLAPEVEASLSPEMRRLLGYKVWATLGGVEGPGGADVDGFVRRPSRPIVRLP